MLLSLCMIVKNEQDVLADCLVSAKAVVDEMIIVDTGSNDATIDIAESHGARVIKAPWTDNFSEARNVALQNAVAEWILHLDADERVATESAANLRSYLQHCRAGGLQVILRNHQPAGDMVRYSDERQVRVFRNREDIRYRNSVHEQIVPSIINAGLTLEDCNLIIEHFGYCQTGNERHRRNLRLLQLDRKNSDNDGYYHFKLGETYKALKQWGMANEELSRALHLFKHSEESELLSLIHIRLAQIALMRNAYHDAILNADCAIHLGHERELALYIKGVALMYRQRITDAFPVFEELLAAPNTAHLDLSDVQKLVKALEAV